jgi:hypothetical protein
MKRNVIVDIITAMLLLILACSKNPIYQSKHETIDLQQSTFSSLSYDSLQPTAGGKFFYGIFNDDQVINIRLKITDETTQKKMLFNGMTIWIDKTGKHKEKLGFKFPAAITPGDHYSMQAMSGKGHNFAANRKTLVNNIKLDHIDFIGFKNATHVLADINTDDKGYLYYQVSLPLNELFAGSSINLQAQKITVGIKSEKPEMPSGDSQWQGERPSEDGGMRPGGMGRDGIGGGYGGGQPGQFTGNRMNPTQSFSEPVNTWIEVHFTK